VKFDKETIIVFCICLALLFAWQPFAEYMGWIPKAQPAPAKVEPAQPVSKKDAPETVKKTETATAAPQKEQAKTDIKSEISLLPEQKIGNDFSLYVFNPNKGILNSISFLKYFNEDHKTPIKSKENIYPGALAIYGETAWRVNEIIDNSADESSRTYKLVRKITNGTSRQFVLTQKWQVTDDYVMDYSFSIKNNDKSELNFPQLSVMGVALQPFSIVTNDKDVNRENHTIDYCTEAGKLECIDTDDGDDDFFAPAPGKIRWCGGSNKYFTSLIMPVKAFDSLVPKRELFSETDEHPEYYSAALGGSYSKISIPAESEVTFNFKCYNGPKIIAELAKFDGKAPEIMNLSYGGPMDWIAEKLLSFLIFLKGVCGSYGWSIIIITMIVRLLFWPVTQKANNSMKRMQKLQPQMKEIREKYKSDPQVMNAKVMELYRQEKVNPLGGCLPILLQIPVFIALYSTLNGAVELRQVPFWWIQDLAKPDTVATIFGLAINPLILIMTSLMILQQRLTPAAMDPNQQKMMMFMPLIMLFMLYNLPAGLTLYWTVSQIFAILQLLLQKHMNSGEKNKPVKKAA
jgi:YidC/Oxa1 family membrane protein insertase